MAEIKQKYDCALLLTMDLFGGKWKLRILWHILHGDNRYSLLMRGIPDITQKMLTTQLKELEINRIIIKDILIENPPKVVIYHVNEKYKGIIPIIEELCEFTKKYAIENSIKVSE